MCCDGTALQVPEPSWKREGKLHSDFSVCGNLGQKRRPRYSPRVWLCECYTFKLLCQGVGLLPRRKKCSTVVLETLLYLCHSVCLVVFTLLCVCVFSSCILPAGDGCENLHLGPRPHYPSLPSLSKHPLPPPLSASCHTPTYSIHTQEVASLLQPRSLLPLS